MENQIDNTQPGPGAKRSPIVIKYAVIISLLMMIITIFTYITNIDMDKMKWPITFLNFAILIMFTIMGMIETRTKLYGGLMSYGKALSVGMLILMTIVLIMALFTFCYYKFIAPGDVDELLRNAESTLQEKGITGDMYDRSMSMNRKIFTPVGMMIGSTISLMFIGTLINLIISLFAQRTK